LTPAREIDDFGQGQRPQHYEAGGFGGGALGHYDEEDHEGADEARMRTSYRWSTLTRRKPEEKVIKRQ